jgi:hypothetical protein
MPTEQNPQWELVLSYGPEGQKQRKSILRAPSLHDAIEKATRALVRRGVPREQIAVVSGKERKARG